MAIGIVHVEGQYVPVARAGVIVGEVRGERAEILQVPDPDEVGEALGIAQVVAGDLKKLGRAVGAGAAGPPEDALVHFVQGPEVHLHAAVFEVLQVAGHHVEAALPVGVEGGAAGNQLLPLRVAEGTFYAAFPLAGLGLGGRAGVKHDVDERAARPLRLGLVYHRLAIGHVGGGEEEVAAPQRRVLAGGRLHPVGPGGRGRVGLAVVDAGGSLSPRNGIEIVEAFVSRLGLGGGAGQVEDGPGQQGPGVANETHKMGGKRK